VIDNGNIVGGVDDGDVVDLLSFTAEQIVDEVTPL